MPVDLPRDFFDSASAQAASASRAARALSSAVEAPAYGSSHSLLVSLALEFGVAFERMSSQLRGGFGFVSDSYTSGPYVVLSLYSMRGNARLSLVEFADLVDDRVARPENAPAAAGPTPPFFFAPVTDAEKWVATDLAASLDLSTSKAPGADVASVRIDEGDVARVSAHLWERAAQVYRSDVRERFLTGWASAALALLLEEVFGSAGTSTRPDVLPADFGVGAAPTV